MWRIKFAPREGRPPRLTFAANAADEATHVISRLRWLIESQEVRPEDVLVLTHRKQRVFELAQAAESAAISGVAKVSIAFQNKEQALTSPGQLTFSTVASAKGYDAHCVLLASANEFASDVKGRATFYVGCTRAIEVLETSAYARWGLANEMHDVLQRLGDTR